MSGRGGKKRVVGSKYFPFCSERCKLTDLGAWLDAEYAISGKTEDAEADETDGS